MRLLVNCDDLCLRSLVLCLVTTGLTLSGCSDDESSPAADPGDTSSDVSDAGGDSDADPETDAAVDAAGDTADGSDADLDAAVDVTSSDVDATTDAVGTDVEEDTSGPTCSFPSPAYGDDAASVALRTDASACGQTAFGWIDTGGLGELQEMGDRVDFPAALLSAVLESENIVLPQPPTYDVGVQVYQYGTQDKGVAASATSLIAVPTNLPDDAAPARVVLLLHGTAGFNDACAPSAETETRALASLFASLGYVTVAPDYLGLGSLVEREPQLHSYLVGQPTAIASLDAIRAAQAVVAEMGIDNCVSPEVLVVGGSQGGHAALWVDRLVDHYAAELDVLGVVATVPPADLIAQATAALLEVRQSTANTAVMFSTAAYWYGYADRLNEVLREPWDTQLPEALISSCDFDDAELPDTLEGAFTESILTAAQDGELASVNPWGCMFAENGLVTASVARIGEDSESFGILYVTAGDDRLVDTPIERGSFTTLCESGMPLQYLECAGASHTQGTLWALPEILAFLRARENREPFVGAVDCAATEAVRCQGTPADE